MTSNHSPRAGGARIPSATYRLQFNSDFTFRQARDLLDYFARLGVSDLYTSPLLAARPGSMHGYDITDHSRLNPELGTEQEFMALAGSLRERGMGLLLDVVPNHMCIASGDNRWWSDVLENGPSSPFARYFDIDWHPPKSDLRDKVLLPMLGDQYGRVLENQEISVHYEHGAFFAVYYDKRLPMAPRSYLHILEPMLVPVKVRLGEDHPQVLELESIMTAIGHLPPRWETEASRVRERQREKEIIKRRLATLVEESGVVRRALEDSLVDLNGRRGMPQSFDRLERLLADQAYRLCYWRVAADEINYRRFFDINELAAIRTEDPAVFAAAHETVLRLIEEGYVTGLRIDHMDGLFDPVQYLGELQQACLEVTSRLKSAAAATERGASLTTSVQASSPPPFYIVAEKILGRDEQIRPDWPIYGTTGYDFLNLLNGVFVDTTNESAMVQVYERFTGKAANFDDLVYECKKLILRVAMSSELHVLARKLDRISEQHRYTRDFTLNSLQYALGEVIACFPVYRSYTRRNQMSVSEEDRRHISRAINDAKRRNPAMSPSIFDFIGGLLLLNYPEKVTAIGRAERRDFVLRFQQLTGPVMAKGMEDTAFYRYYPLASLNEVGSEPQRSSVRLDEFHALNEQRARARLLGLSATSTHDTKRSEDVRARLNVLSEMPGRWLRAIRRWKEINDERKIELNDLRVPSANEEYLLYQTLVGAWPLSPMKGAARTEFITRMEEYLVKAMREAKVQTSWISQNEEYERAAREFIRAILQPGRENRFLRLFLRFQEEIARAGMFNSLSQTLLKTTLPGVPDFYQGTEIWDFSLVDPDNRRPVDYELRRRLLSSIESRPESERAQLIEEMKHKSEDGRIKLYIIMRALAFRRAHADLFNYGDYLPLTVRGEKSNNAICFARVRQSEACIVAAGRFFTRLGRDAAGWPVGEEAWRDTRIEIGEDQAWAPGRYRELLSGEVFTLERGAMAQIPLAQLLARLPVALLVKETAEASRE